MRTRFILMAIAVLSLMTTPSQARPRDEVMSGAFRCAKIGDTRVWLDCFYGAAQPARAALSMPAVPAAQARLASQPPAGQPADIALRDQVIAEAFRCNGLADERQWLGCYYAAANPARARLGLSVTPPVKSAAPPAQTSFGLPVPKAARPDQVNSRMASYAFDRYGIFTVTLENGEVWRQISGDDSFARWNKPARQYLVRITRGALGSFNLQVRDNPGLFKVRRVT